MRVVGVAVGIRIVKKIKTTTTGIMAKEGSS